MSSSTIDVLPIISDAIALRPLDGKRSLSNCIVSFQPGISARHAVGDHAADIDGLLPGLAAGQERKAEADGLATLPSVRISGRAI